MDDFRPALSEESTEFAGILAGDENTPADQYPLLLELREVEGLVAAGVVEVNLVSQDTIAYGRDLTPRDSLSRIDARTSPLRYRSTPTPLHTKTTSNAR